MSNPKVFEFAKEVGMTPLALMDKIKEWQIPVKSHMAELTPDLLSNIREKMEADAKPAGGAEKKAAPKKRAPAKAKAPIAPKKAAAAAAAEEKAKATKAGATVVRRKAKTADELKAEVDAAAALEAAEAEANAPAVEEAPAPVVKAAAVAATPTPVEEEKPVVKTTKKAADPAPEKLADAPVAKASAEARAEAPAATASQAEAPAKTAVAKTTAAPAAPVEATAPVAAANAPASAVTAAPTTAAPKAASPMGAPKAPSPIGAAPVAGATPAPVSTPAAPAAAKFVARKKEVAIGQSGVSSEPAPAVRRNIVGRMDLSRVQNPNVRQQRAPTDSGPARPVPGSGNFTPRPKGNLRAGFVQSAGPTPDMFPPAGGLDNRRTDDKKRGVRGGAPDAGPNGKEIDAAPPAFDPAEFRKREMVFQPKKKKIVMGRAKVPVIKTTPAAHKRVVKITGNMKLVDLGEAIGVKASDLTRALIKSGVMATMNSDLDFDTIALIVPEFGWEAQNVHKSDTEMVADTAFGDMDAVRITRPPVVTVMGHVDHGKTSLLDSIRKAKVAAGEKGGITQHIGAYQVTFDDGYKITFLDTPGHEAFTAMRARGANVTDIAVIVVAADDGVMPQTVEAINHAKAAGVPMIVAVNKMDKPGANPEKIKQQLTEYEVVPEEWGGTTMFVGVSALKGTGIPELLEQIRLIAEVAELKANPARSATGVVIESKLEKGRGPVATILIQDGTLKVGQHVVAGAQVGRIRSLTNDRGEKVTEAVPGMPVEVLGLDGVPQAGDKFDVVKDERSAEEVATVRKAELDKAKRVTGKQTIEEIFAKATRGDVKDLPVVLKADVAGSLEALHGMFAKLSTPEVKVKIIHSAVGGINESDVLLAATAGGMMIGFNVRPDGNASTAAKQKGIEIRTYGIVYELIDDMKKAMTGMLTPDVVEKVMGKAEVRNTFSVPKIGVIAGCFVSDGKISRANQARLVRDGKVIYEGKISSLKRFKDDAKEVATGFECGIGIEGYNDLKVGDVIEAFVKEEVARTLEGPGVRPTA